uniref:SERPIN domain-containing protein n=1 Tax=Caenorhabditis tropicalis TaxID=1561998 RepID=A0A1I7UJM3_9PELO
MWLRLSLLACFISLADFSKLHEIVKNVGKRFEDNPNLYGYVPVYGECLYNAKCSFGRKTEDEVRKIKLNSALRTLSAFYDLASSENKNYEAAMTWLWAVMDPDMTAVICDQANKTLNAYQYMKYLRETGVRFEKTPRVSWKYQIETTSRYELKFGTMIFQLDKKFNLTAQIHYVITMRLNPDKEKYGTFFSIQKVETGGVCRHHGALYYDVHVDDLEEFKNHPTARTLLGFFTPLSYQFTDPEQKRIPEFWLKGLEKDKSEMYVCVDPTKDSVKYTEEQFKSWYHRFGIMWHAEKDKEEDFASISVQKIEDNKIIAIVTMKLRMGINPKVMDWNFRVAGAKSSDVDNGTRWYLDRVEVPCHPDYSAKDEAFRSIADVIATTFVEDLVDLPDPTQWYSTVAFVKRFTDQGLKEFKYCDAEKVKTDIPLLDKFIFDRNVLKIIKYTKYWVDHSGFYAPAPDSETVRFKTISVAQRGGVDIEYENEWKFEIKWHDMDKFFYVETMEIGCHNKIVDGKYGDGVEYQEIDYFAKK